MSFCGAIPDSLFSVSRSKSKDLRQQYENRQLIAVEPLEGYWKNYGLSSWGFVGGKRN
jgi:hypothetical protein